ncbi:ThiF family adenylyltransferase [Planctomycetota bacterium]
MRSSGQTHALEQLRRVEAGEDGALTVVGVDEPPDFGDALGVHVRLRPTPVRRSARGVALGTSEPFVLHVPWRFPLKRPHVTVSHERFALQPHVQWKRHLCLYQAPGVEWDPHDGMFGLVLRLHDWLVAAARGDLDPEDAPLHPPAVYASAGSDRVIVRENAPAVYEESWFGFATLRTHGNHRVDVIGWRALSDALPAGVIAPAILLHRPFPFEYPAKLSTLLDELAGHGVNLPFVLRLLGFAVLVNGDNRPLHVVIGTKMRRPQPHGPRLQHLAVWRVFESAASLLRMTLNKDKSAPALQEVGALAEAAIEKWAAAADVEWCRMIEDRPEVTTRRDHESPVQWFRGKNIALWGCGALGSFLAESLVRAGARRLVLRDNGIVTPGLLVRQHFDDEDVGEFKAAALQRRLLRIRPTLTVEVHRGDLLERPLGCAWPREEDVDLIIETTGSNALLAAIESCHQASALDVVPVASFAVGRNAVNGLAVLADNGHTGGPLDCMKRMKLELSFDPAEKSFYEDFWPQDPPTLFQPEPGCSEPTFVGSFVDVAVIGGRLLNWLGSTLTNEQRGTGHGYAVSRVPTTPSVSYSWCPSLVLTLSEGLTVRLSQIAWKSIRSLLRACAEEAGPSVETGGHLFGERDDAGRVIWVHEATAATLDSHGSPSRFVCGTDGVQDRHDHLQAVTGTMGWVGMWHSHPEGKPLPSPIDLTSMTRLSAGAISAGNLMLIVGVGCDTLYSLGASLFSSVAFEPRTVRVALANLVDVVPGEHYASARSSNECAYEAWYREVRRHQGSAALT